MAISFGIVLICFMGKYMTWKVISLFCFAIPIMTIFWFHFSTESPQWLFMQGREAEAKQAIESLQPNDHEKVQEEMKGYHCNKVVFSAFDNSFKGLLTNLVLTSIMMIFVLSRNFTRTKKTSQL